MKTFTSNSSQENQQKRQKVSGFHICDILELDEEDDKNNETETDLDISDNKNNDSLEINSDNSLDRISNHDVSETESTSPPAHSLFSNTLLHYQNFLQNPAMRPWLYNINQNGEFYLKIFHLTFLKRYSSEFKFS